MALAVTMKLALATTTLTVERSGPAGAQAQAPGIKYHGGIIALESKLGGVWGGREGSRVWCSTRLGSRFVNDRSVVKGQFGFVIDAVKDSALFSQFRTGLSGGSFASLSSATTSYGGGGRSGIGGRGAGGGGGGGGDGFEARAADKAAAVGQEQSDELPVGISGDDVIILDVGGMSCGGCSASVKRILESQPQVSLAKVDLATETAFVQISFDGQTDQATLKQEIGELLAQHLTSCGFKSIVRGWVSRHRCYPVTINALQKLSLPTVSGLGNDAAALSQADVGISWLLELEQLVKFASTVRVREKLTQVVDAKEPTRGSIL